MTSPKNAKKTGITGKERRGTTVGRLQQKIASILWTI
jgi:hypothetical protein